MQRRQSLSRSPRVHFCGIGGTGMVGGARLAIEDGWEVRGSDTPLYPPTSIMVETLGVPVAGHYDAANLDWGPDLVVIGNALSRGNPEVEAALDRKLHYVSLPEWIKDNVLRQRRPVAICGTHGKTTTTALTAFLLDRAGLEPGYLIGGQPIDFEHSARLGPAGNPFAIEGDEYDTAFFDKRAKFFHYLPEIAVVTSIEFDHGDIYASLAEIECAFRLMLRQIPASGWLVACADDPGAAALTEHAFGQATTYGFGPGANWRGEWRKEETAAGEYQSVLTIHRGGERWAEIATPLFGRHNMLNTLAAVAVAGLLGAPPRVLERAMPEFNGVRRRMEIFLRARGMTFVDDFAHHPTAIRETIKAARGRWPQRCLRVLFEPRSNTTVTNRFQDDLRTAFALADEVWLGPIHRAGEIDPAERLDREGLTRELGSGGVLARCSDDVAEMVASVLGEGREGDVVLILSNGAFGGLYDLLRAACAE